MATNKPYNRRCSACDALYPVNPLMVRYDHWLCPDCKHALDIAAIAIGQAARESILFRKF